MVSIGWSHEFAPTGIVTEVVVCTPATQTHFTVSPTVQLKLKGAKKKLSTPTVNVTARVFEEESKQIAKEMNLSTKTIENRRKALRIKLGVKSIVGLIKYGFHNGIFW